MNTDRKKETHMTHIYRPVWGTGFPFHLFRPLVGMVIGALLLVSGAAQAAVLLVDFSNEKAWPGAPADWNVFGGAYVNGVNQNLTDIEGDATGINLAISGFTGYGGSTWGIGSLSPGLGSLAQINASADGLFVNAGLTGVITLSGLRPDLLHTLTLFAARSNATDRFTFFTATGAAAQTESLQVSGPGSGDSVLWNNDDTVTFQLMPSPAGVITIGVVGKTTDNIGGVNTFGYLNSMELSYSIPEPSTLSLVGLFAAGLACYRRKINGRTIH